VIGIKESGGDVEKVRKMVAGTRHIRRGATVTETFEAVTPRMLAAATAGPAAEGGELVSIAALSGSGAGPAMKPSSSAVTMAGKMKTRQKEVGFQVMVGAADQLHASLAVGAVGAILAFACFAPTACYEIYTAWKEGDAELAQLKQQRITPASQYVIGELGISGVKHGMDFNGYFGGPVRLPLLPLTGDAKNEVERRLSDVRN
jgi:dihydrodipicolinate synthase/N-acetylneuraminate lyase